MGLLATISAPGSARPHARFACMLGLTLVHTRATDRSIRGLVSEPLGLLATISARLSAAARSLRSRAWANPRSHSGHGSNVSRCCERAVGVTRHYFGTRLGGAACSLRSRARANPRSHSGHGSMDRGVVSEPLGLLATIFGPRLSAAAYSLRSRARANPRSHSGHGSIESRCCERAVGVTRRHFGPGFSAAACSLRSRARDDPRSHSGHGSIDSRRFWVTRSPALRRGFLVGEPAVGLTGRRLCLEPVRTRR